MNKKKYFSINEVSDLLKIKKHVIRYWDAKFEGISTRRSATKRRFFSFENIKRLKELKEILYQNGRHNYSLDLAKKIVNKKLFIQNKTIENNNIESSIDVAKLSNISKNLKNLLKL